MKSVMFTPKGASTLDILKEAEHTANYNITTEVSSLMDEILTLVEIILPQGSQLSALKDQIKSAINRRHAQMHMDITDTFQSIGNALGADFALEWTIIPGI